MFATFPNRHRRTQILQIALPITGGMVSQNVLNLVDAAMVGSLGDVALAATGIGSFANFMALSLILGLATGVQAIASRRLGEGRHTETAKPLDGGLLLALVLGLPISLLLIQFSPGIFVLLNNDADVVAAGTPYLQIRLAAMVGVGMNFAFRGYWSAVKMTRLYLSTILVMHTVNIFLNWVFIFGHLGAPELGVFGAGLATTLSVYLGTTIYFVLAWFNAREAGFLHGLPRRETMMTMIRVSLPSSVQQLFFSAGMVALLWIVGRIGTAELAATNVLLTLGLVAMLPAIGLGISSASLVGHALGRNDRADAKLWGWNVTMIACLAGLFIGLPAVILKEPILSVFLHDAETLRIAATPLMLSGLLIWCDTAGMALFHAHLGAGATRRVMLVSIVCQWLLFLPLAYLVGPILGHGLLVVWCLQIGYRVLQAALFAWSWWRERWVGIQV